MENTKEVCGYTFAFLQNIEPKTNADGSVFEYSPQERYAKKKSSTLHEHGNGSFCDFAFDKAKKEAGVYLWVCDGEILYIGETKNMRKRFSSEYGHISPRKCYRGGQSTNCKMNNVALEHAKQGKNIAIYFLATDKHKQIEKELLTQIKTPYNKKNN